MVKIGVGEQDHFDRRFSALGGSSEVNQLRAQIRRSAFTRTQWCPSELIATLHWFRVSIGPARAASDWRAGTILVWNSAAARKS